MNIKQISVFLENKEGRLAHVTGVLSQAGINILALSLADTSDFGILRLIVDRPRAAFAILREQNIVNTLHEVIAVEVDNQPGGLHRILKALDGSGVNVEYMYAFVEKSSDNAVMIFRIENIENAIRALQKRNIVILDNERVTHI